VNVLSLVALVAIGVCSGAVTGLIGASGVLVVVPALTLVLGLPIHAAIGTSLAVDVIASAVVSYVYYRMGNIELRSGVGLALGAVLGAQAGSRFAAMVPSARLGRAFGFFLIVAGAGRLSGKGLLGLLHPSDASRKVEPSRGTGSKPRTSVEFKRVAFSIIVGFLLGILSGIFGAGGGILFLLTLILLLKYPIHKAVGTSTLMMAVTALSGAIAYALNGYISFLAAALVGAGTIAGGRIGAVYANKVPEETLSKIIGAIFVALGVFMIAEQLFRI
jgi:hypothetical protein